MVSVNSFVFLSYLSAEHCIALVVAHYICVVLEHIVACSLFPVQPLLDCPVVVVWELQASLDSLLYLHCQCAADEHECWP